MGLVVALLGATRAEAHVIASGMGSFYDGIGHFFLSPDDVLAVLALILLAGMRGSAASTRLLFTLPVAWAGAGVIGLLTTAPALSGQIPSACSILLLGLLVASDLPLATWIVMALALIAGGLHGYFNGQAMREAGVNPALIQLAGVGFTLFVLVLHLTDWIQKARRPWMRIVLRVMGSWLGAAGLLLLGWSLRTRGG